MTHVNVLLVIKKEELDYIKQIKEENIRLKESIKFKDREIDQKTNDLEKVKIRKQNYISIFVFLFLI